MTDKVVKLSIDNRLIILVVLLVAGIFSLFVMYEKINDQQKQSNFEECQASAYKRFGERLQSLCGKKDLSECQASEISTDLADHYTKMYDDENDDCLKIMLYD
ncbi:MAG TPA: hypothetical protein PKU78_05235 [Candidatus Dojkabacteria bacterium]|nr:hypothetical protein [Candidatus Dojkabacteria bacterium]HRO65599.1 hypothetical protein [Candidatus Dojkabacteria bacterium]HRP37791.1 hypothetical protein [Candidatus Dojkabacteria bacterium]HRP50805.1 hypothetical protein [Candidatus Dojkabacteria bacterium]